MRQDRNDSTNLKSQRQREQFIRASAQIHAEKPQQIFRSVETTTPFTLRVCLKQLLAKGERRNKPRHNENTVQSQQFFITKNKFMVYARASKFWQDRETETDVSDNCL